MLDCAGCGAPLAIPPSGHVAVCAYCGRDLIVRDHRVSAAEVTPPTLADRLLRGPLSEDHGQGTRHGVAAMKARDWACHERGVWPVAARASSSYGSGWSTTALVGAPAVYPRCGDLPGAWAPGTRRSQVEWVELDYPGGVPPAEAIRVFETCVPGATFAITTGHGDAEELLWHGQPGLCGTEASVLEVPLAPPRALRSLRVYVSNGLGHTWSEIDTVGLVATEPIDPSLRRLPRGRRAPWGSVGLLLLVVAAGVALYLATKPPSPRRAPDAPADVVVGTRPVRWNTTVDSMAAAGTVWASAVVERSSQYEDDDNAAERALGAPDVYPRHADDPHAWAPDWSDLGPEWITVRFPRAVRASAVVVVETNAPGAIMRVDDPAGGAVLWSGATHPSEDARALSFELPEPRELDQVRVVLDTTRIAGWNEIDAIGLVPAGP